jgi:uncharacterized protein YbaR (Trm112 family)
MIDQKLINMLRCPFDGSPLELADCSMVERVNEAVSRGEVRDFQDQKITQPIDGGLLNASGDRLYPVRGGIPTLVAGEAIHLRF